jgi:septum formation protein
VVVGDVDEDPLPGEAPLSYLERVTLDKLQAIASQADRFAGCAALLTADTIVRVEERIIGKPRNTSEALELLQLLSGREHIVHTRYAVSAVEDWGSPILARTVTSRVFLRLAEEQVLARYARTGEGLDKAGAYAVQGIGAFLVERIEGSYSNVVGLPVCEVIADLMEAKLLEDFPS